MPNAQYKDDPAILDADVLYRRIHPNFIINDQKRGTRRPSSAAFTNSSDGTPMSVAVAKLLATPADALVGYNQHSLFALTAATARRFKQAVLRAPMPDDPAHGYVAGDKKPHSIREGLALAGRWEILAP